MADTPKDAPQTGNPDIQGEGNYDAARKFDAEERAFVEKGGYEKKANDAKAALDGPQSAELERARKETAERGKGMGKT